MKDEYWGTFSIYDHRSPAYKQSLLFFDRIVVPVPDNPIGRLKEQELDALRADVSFLEAEGAARLVRWDQAEFEQWRDAQDNPGIGAPEGMARSLMGDPRFLSRLMLKEQTYSQLDSLRAEVDALSITAIPVYPADASFEAASKALEDFLPQQLTIDVALRALPMPSADTPFEEILRVRNSEPFQRSLAALREWMSREVVMSAREDPEVTVSRAVGRLEKMASDYRDALKSARYTKVSGAITSILAIGGAVAAVPVDPAIKILAGVATPFFSFRSLFRPCWKDLQANVAFPAGVICEAETLKGVE